jgi:hypothetical protein
MYKPQDVKDYIAQIIDDLDEGRTPRRRQLPWWVRAVAGPAAIGLTVGLAGCDTTETPSLAKDDAMQGKADGFTDSLCLEIGAESGCDLCAEMGWYDDGVCDDFCESVDPECGGAVLLYGVPPITCEQDADCPDGSQCVTTTTGTCPEGAYCILAPRTTGTCEPTMDCDADAACPAGSTCVEGECVVGDVVALYGVPPMNCETDAECPDGTRCVTPDSGTCPEGAYCILPPSGSGTCEPVTECETDAECPDGQYCMADSGCPEGAYCILPPPGTRTGVCVESDDGIVPLYGVPTLNCESDAECPDGTRCVSPDVGQCPEGAYCILPPSGSGTCEPVAECSNDADCDAGMICTDGACEFGMVPLYGVPSLECDADADCPAGSRCVSPDASTCPEGAYCILPPGGAGTCEPVVECETDADCPDGSECVQENDCPPGAYCILPPSGNGTCVTR